MTSGGQLGRWGAACLLALGCHHDWDGLLYEAPAAGGAGGDGGQGGEAGAAGGGEGGSPSVQFALEWAAGYGVGVADLSDGPSVAAVNEEVAIGGQLVADVDMGGGLLQSAGADDILVAGLDEGGGWRWSERYGNSAFFQAVVDAAADSLGEVVMVGSFSGMVDFDGTTLDGEGVDAFVLKLDTSGNRVWALDFGDVALDSASAVAIAHNDDVLVAGSFGGTITFNTSHTADGDENDLFVARFNPGSANLWSVAFHGDDTLIATAITGCPGGDLILVGAMEGTATFDSEVLVAEGVDGFVARLSGSSGSVLDAFRFGDAGDSAACDVACSTDEDAVVVGGGVGVPTPCAGVVTAAGDAYARSFDAAGTEEWAWLGGGAASQRASSLALTNDHAVVIGTFEDSLGGLTSAGGEDVFLVELDGAGQLIGAARFGDDSVQRGTSLGLTPSGDVLVGGLFIGSPDFGDGPVDAVSTGSDRDYFLARFARVIQ